MFGSVNYFTECLMTTVMNRLVTDDGYSLEEIYVNLRREIEKRNESDLKKEDYLKNLEKAFEGIMIQISGEEVVEEI